MTFRANVLLDHEGCILRWNGSARRLFGFGGEATLGRHASLLYGGGNRTATLLETAAAVGHADYEGQCVREDGSAFDGRTLATVFRDGRDVRGFSLVIRNLAEHSGALPQLRRLYSENLGAREDERTRIAYELNEELGERLTAMQMDLHWLDRRLPGGDGQVAERIANVKQMMDAAVAAVRRITADLRPAELDNLGLVPALEQLLRELTARTGAGFRLDTGTNGAEFREPLATAVYRMLQDALAAVARHAPATEVRVALRLDGDNLVIGLRGDLGGVDAEVRERSSCPVRVIKERVRAFGGIVHLSRVNGGANALDIVMPVTP